MFKQSQAYLASILFSASSLFANDTSLGSEIAGFFSGKKNTEVEEQTSIPSPLKTVLPPVLLPTQPCPDNWRFSGEFLYLLPTLDDTYFLLNSDVSTSYPNGKRVNNDFGFNPAFRIGAEYAFCDSYREMQGSYSYFNAETVTPVVGSNLWATIGRADLANAFENYSGSAQSTLNLLFQHADVKFSQRVLNCAGVYFYLQPALEYAYLRLDEHYSYTSATNTASIAQKSRMWGLGPQIGLTLDHTFYQSHLNASTRQAVSVTSVFAGGLLMGQGTTKNAQSLAGATILQTVDEHTWRTIPALHAKVGLNYQVSYTKVGAMVGVGYEFNSYVRALSRTIFADDSADGQCSTNYYNYDLQGFYISAALSF